MQAEVPPRPWHRMRVDRQGERDLPQEPEKWAKKLLVMRKLTDMVMGDKFLAQPLRHPAAPLTGPAARTAFSDEWELQALTALLALAAYACQQPRRQAAGGALAPGDQDEGHISLEQLDQWQCAPCTFDWRHRGGLRAAAHPTGNAGRDGAVHRLPALVRGWLRRAPASGSGSPGRAFEVSW